MDSCVSLSDTHTHCFFHTSSPDLITKVKFLTRQWSASDSQVTWLSQTGNESSQIARSPHRCLLWFVCVCVCHCHDRAVIFSGNADILSHPGILSTG